MNQNHQYLIIGGSTKCATTSVFNYFEFHPQICACNKKESRYFLEENYKLIAKQRNNNSADTFDDLFNACNHNTVRIEATPDYLYSPFAADKIKSELASCKLVFILRNPQTRIKSWYRFALLNGLIPSETTFENYILNQKHNTENAAQHLRSVEQSRYAMYLDYYFNKFGRENILVCFYEELQNNPELFCKEICRFISIDENYFNNFDFKVYNKTVSVKSVKAHQLFRKFKRGVRPITKLFPQALRKKLKLAGYKLEQSYTTVNSSTTGNNTELNKEAKLYLESYFKSWNEKLVELTGKNLPW